MVNMFFFLQPLKRALLRMGAPNLVPESMENYLSYSVLNYLKKLKNQVKYLLPLVPVKASCQSL